MFSNWYVQVLFERDFKSAAFGGPGPKDVYHEHARPNCAVTFFRNKIMVHKPFLIFLEGTFVVGLSTPRSGLKVESVYVSIKDLKKTA